VTDPIEDMSVEEEASRTQRVKYSSVVFPHTRQAPLNNQMNDEDNVRYSGDI